MKRHSIWRSVMVLALALTFFAGQVTWALAGVTGGVSGTITDDAGAPVAGAAVSFTSPSQNATGKSDAGGHFSFLALAPDTYTVSVEKDGFNPVAVSGVTVFADNNQQLAVHMTKALKTIARVTTRGAGSLVKSGVGGDIYNVNAASIAASAVLGGGANLNSAYSAISSVPGVNVSIGGMGWNQTVYVRGAQAFFTGYEYDGVPVNRAFDNYNASTESNLGLQELQVYTGGGPASNSSSGTSGFINQVIKTGTYPGYASFSGGVASDAFYHQAKVEAGGASPDRNFSYYVGLSGYNQSARFLDNSNGAGFMGPGGIYSDNSFANGGLSDDLPVGGAFSYCNSTTGATPASALAAYNSQKTGGVVNPLLVSPSNPSGSFGAACLTAYSGLAPLTSFLQDRENVINFHFGIPRKNGQKDDIQLLWSGSMLKTQFYSSVNDMGGYNAFQLLSVGDPYVAPAPGGSCPLFSSCPGYVDTYVYNAPFGAKVAGLTPTLYQEPDSPTGRAFDGQLDPNQEDGIYNDQGIVKAQYTHPLGDRAYLRGDIYTFFSDWNLAGASTTLGGYVYGNPSACCANNYLLNTHTTGGELQFSDQLNDKNLIQITSNYTSARVLRDNNTTNLTAGNPFGIVAGNGASGFTCYSPAGPVTTANPTPDSVIPDCYGATLGNASTVAETPGYTYPVVGPHAAAAGANLVNLWSGGESASYNQVDPDVLNLSLSDQFRPNDKWLINGAMRFEDYTYNLPNSTDDANEFYAAQAANTFCYNTAPGLQGVYTAPLPPGQFPPANPIQTTGDCNALISANTGATVTTYVHPNGTTQDGIAAPSFTANSPSSYKLNYWSARYSATYTQSPDTVWRFSGGRFIEPPISASVDYLNNSGNNVKQWANFMDLGFFSPFHNTPSMTSAQYDGSLERHVHGTDMSFKLTPFYSFTNGYQEQSFIGPGYVTQVPVGRQRSYGMEAAITKGDFSKDGLSGSYALTYTNAKVQYQSGLVNNLGANQIGYYNTAITDYNALAKGGSQNYPCFSFATNPGSGYQAGTGVGTKGVAQACGGQTVANPYFSAAAQATLDPNGWYAPASDIALPGVNSVLGLYDTPWVNTLILNYRHDKWAVTPSLQVSSGSSYGSPLTAQGVDPRLCTAVDTTQTAATNECAYTSLVGQGATNSGLLYIPNPQSGSFDGIGAYREPNIMVGNIGFSYDVTPKITLNLTLANVFHTCFGGSKEAWTSAYPAGSNVCGYVANSIYVSNFQLGNGYLTPGNISSYSASANGTSLYPVQFQSYAPSTSNGAAGAIPEPFNAYLTINVKL
jgi:hypothetical protein